MSSLTLTGFDRPVAISRENSDATPSGPLERNSPPASLLDAIDQMAARERQFARRQLDGDVRLAGDGILLNGQPYRFTPSSLARFASHVGAPPGYVGQLPQPVRNALLQHHVDEGDLQQRGNIKNSQAIVRDGEFVALCDGDLAALTVDVLVEGVSAGLGAELESMRLYRFEMSDDLVVLEVASPRCERAVRVGDPLFGGLQIRHSPTGQQATQLWPFIYRLVCANGMHHRRCLRQREISRTRRLPASSPLARQRLVDQVRRLASSAWSGVREHLDHVAELSQERVDVPELLQQYLRQVRLYSQTTIRQLLAAWEQEGHVPSDGALGKKSSASVPAVTLAADAIASMAAGRTAGPATTPAKKMACACLLLFGGPELCCRESTGRSSV